MERLTEHCDYGWTRVVFEKISDHCGDFPCKEAGGCRCAKDRTCPWLKVIVRLAAYEDTGLKPEEISDLMVANGEKAELLHGYGINAPDYTHLRELAEADKDGRCVVLPCRFYDEVYALSQAGGEIIHGEIRSTNKDFCLIVNLEGNLTSKGKTWSGVQVRKQDIYLTCEAAEAALKAGDPR